MLPMQRRGAKQEWPVCNIASASGSGSLLAFTPPKSTLAITAASTTPGSVTSALAGLEGLTPVRRLGLPDDGRRLPSAFSDVDSQM